MDVYSFFESFVRTCVKIHENTLQTKQFDILTKLFLKQLNEN